MKMKRTSNLQSWGELRDKSNETVHESQRLNLNTIMCTLMMIPYQIPADFFQKKYSVGTNLLIS